ncbi:MAG: AAA family ATPase [Desulfomonile tiedjei]|uniref:AAA family ATPase n=1 Tax=Desulfomonile tiedjei TaxID=2358 RepID=A0A9D6V5J8_9BACT|nr:AAA family ATPase [Desulfomonile tiedjei]
MGFPTVVAICGKGGVGKTVFGGAVLRVFWQRCLRILAVDADPAMGLRYLLGLKDDIKTLGDLREDLIRRAKTDRDPEQIAGAMDYLLLEALTETDKFSFLAMGRSRSRGCFCPVNSLLKESARKLAQNYDVVLVDAEAGVEQINREVMSSVDSIVVLMDNSQRSRHSVELIKQMAVDLNMRARMGVVLNRAKDLGETVHAAVSALEVPVWGTIPEDEELLRNDALGRSVFDLPANSPVLESAERIVDFLVEA